MAEKRFECYDLIFLDGFIKDTLTNENIVEPIELIDLLNELYDENQRLKFQLEECKHNKLFSRRELEEQNKELKKENNILIKQRLGEERLKQEIADYHTSNGKLHRLNNELIRRLEEFHIDYLDILRNLND